MITASIWLAAYTLFEIVAITAARVFDKTSVDVMREKSPGTILRLSTALASPIVAAILLTIAVNT